MSIKIAAVAQKIVGALESLENGDERRKAILAALASFGDTLISSQVSDSQQFQVSGSIHAPVHGIHENGIAWMQRTFLTRSEIEHVLHVDEEGVSILTAVGDGMRQQTINTYLLTGVAALLQTGKAEFADDCARKNCTDLGCYDGPNHTKAVAAFGNRFTGSKKSGWKLTAPGLTAAAALLKTSEK